MKRFFILLIMALFLLCETAMAANAAQSLKSVAAAARVTNAAAIKARHDAAITRMTALLVAEANKGEERFALPQSDQDYDLWSSPAGLKYIEGRGFSVTDISYASGRVLEISWANPTPDP